jgi:oligopeptide transport system substrate-binding protein
MFGRTWFFALILIAGMLAVTWAVRRSQLPPADFTFGNETEVASVDPALITGIPEARMVYSLFEGLCRPRPQDFLPEAGVAEKWEISDDGLIYTFHLRNNALWSNSEPVTAHDFYYSIRRILDPLTACRYSYQAWYIANAKRYNLGGGNLKPGDPVEIELIPSSDLPNTVRGELLHGKLTRSELSEAETKDESSAGRNRVYVVQIDGKERRFQAASIQYALKPGSERCRQVLLDFREVGVKVIDDRTFQIRLTDRTPYFLDLVAFHCFAAVNQKCLEKYGSPDWTHPDHIVTNGAFNLVTRRLRDRIRLKRSDTYWDREHVRLNVVDALSVDDRTTALNLYMTGMSDWCTVPPVEVIREFMKQKPPRNDFNPAPQLTTYYYLLNNTRPPLDDKRVRQALSLATDREEITRVATGAGEVPALSLVPPAMPHYKPQQCTPPNPTAARKLLAEAGFPDGKGFPKLEILYNNDQQHQAIAELLRKQWQNTLGITASLRAEEWASFQDSQQQLKYLVARRAWVGDYVDPNTYLDMFITNGENNCTGFSNAQYDKLIADAAHEPDKAKRIEILERAERLLMDEMPIIPIYYYVSRNVVRPRVRGFYNNLQDMHPLNAIWIDPNVDEHAPFPNEYMRPAP